MTEDIHTRFRRRFLLTLLHGISLPTIAAATEHKNDGTELYLSAAGGSTESYSLGWAGNTTLSSGHTYSGFRGHSAIQHPRNPWHALMFGRRPATECIVVDLQQGELVHRIQSRPNRHFYGHGVFSEDGRLLYTTENDTRTGEGKIAIRDADNYQLLGEYQAYGIGPHDIKRLPNSNTLVVAVGGILTHPDSGRKKLNLDTMDSSLVYIDGDTGKLLARFRVPEGKASIRHLDVAKDGTVAIAMQIQRQVVTHSGFSALGALHKPGEGIVLIDEPEVMISRMNDYTGSVSINTFSDTVGFTSPRGNIAAFWRISDRQFLGYHAFNDVCGITVSQDQSRFILSNSSGQIRQLSAHTLQEYRRDRISLQNMHWDNHLTLALLP